MRILKLVKEYPHIDRKILQKYKKPEKFILINEDDPDLYTIKVPLPSPPAYHLIDGFGLPPEKQKWEPPKYPEKLTQLEKMLSKKKMAEGSPFVIEDIWEHLESHREEFEEEIEWIRLQWERRLNGYWLFINGTPTYIDGWHYFYCGFWNLDVGLPEYRSRDRKFFLFARFCYTDTMGIVKDEAGNPVLDEDGRYKLYDVGWRICLGFNYPKHRRDGATYRAECVNYEIISRLAQVMGGIQSMTGDKARKAFLKHLVRPWKKLPFFFKPNYDGSTDPKSELIFDKPGIKVGGKGSLVTIETGLESVINYATTSEPNFYDGEKLYFLHDDEVGKTVETDIRHRHDIVKECMCLGGGRDIIGFTIKTSTVEEMVDKGGHNFYVLCEDSHYEKRNENDQTISGLYNLFIPAYDGMEDFIDPYGNSIIEDPKEPVINSKGKIIKIGAKRYLENKRDALLKQAAITGNMEKYYEEVRLRPFSYAECFIASGEDTGLPKQIIIKRINELVHDDNAVRRGNFLWAKGKDSYVVFSDNPEGKFFVSKVLNEEWSNKKVKKDGVWYPMWPERFTSCADPFKFNKAMREARIGAWSRKSRLSNGGGSVFWERDYRTDPEEKDINDWITNRFVCTYSNRVSTKDEYAEDMLMMSVYFGAMMYPEVDIPLIWDYFYDRGYAGFLKYDVDEKTGKIKDKPGYHTAGTTAVVQELFIAVKNYLELHGHRERHQDFLLECKNIKGVEELTKFDLFAACGGALLGSRSTYSKIMEGHKESYDISSYLNPRKY